MTYSYVYYAQLNTPRMRIVRTDRIVQSRE